MRSFILAAALAVSTQSFVSPALAHSELAATNPPDGAALSEAPGEIELAFNETVQLTALRLSTGDGSVMPVARQAITAAQIQRRPLPPLQAGEYRVEWAAISADGHPIAGSFRFRIGPAS